MKDVYRLCDVEDTELKCVKCLLSHRNFINLLLELGPLMARVPSIILVRDIAVALFPMQVSLTRSAKLASNGQAAIYLYHKGGEPT